MLILAAPVGHGLQPYVGDIKGISHFSMLKLQQIKKQ